MVLLPAALSRRGRRREVLPVQLPTPDARLGAAGGSSVAEVRLPQPGRRADSVPALKLPPPLDRRVHAWLRSLGLVRLAPLFGRHEFDMVAVGELTESDLDAMGITDAATRNKLLGAARELRPAGDGPSPGGADPATRQELQQMHQQLTALQEQLQGAARAERRDARAIEQLQAELQAARARAAVAEAEHQDVERLEGELRLLRSQVAAREAEHRNAVADHQQLKDKVSEITAKAPEVVPPEYKPGDVIQLMTNEYGPVPGVIVKVDGPRQYTVRGTAPAFSGVVPEWPDHSIRALSSSDLRPAPQREPALKKGSGGAQDRAGPPFDFLGLPVPGTSAVSRIAQGALDLGYSLDSIDPDNVPYEYLRPPPQGLTSFKYPPRNDQLFVTVSLRPRILYFPQVITDEEADSIVQTAKDHLVRSRVALQKGEEAKDGGVQDVRTSQQTWIQMSQTEVLRRVEARVQNITGSSWHEQLQVLRYQIGQHYDAHDDFFSKQMYGTQRDNRFATFFIYLSSVEEGGHTSLPRANGGPVPSSMGEAACARQPGPHGLRSYPRKGAAVLFYSMRPDLSLDPYALHGGCPVVRGEKWSANLWFHAATPAGREAAGMVYDPQNLTGHVDVLAPPRTA